MHKNDAEKENLTESHSFKVICIIYCKKIAWMTRNKIIIFTLAKKRNDSFEI